MRLIINMEIQSIFYGVACILFAYMGWSYTKIMFYLQRENSALRKHIYVSLDHEDFSCLVRGGILTVARADKDYAFTIKIILKDIGFGIMEAELASAQFGNDIYKGHHKIITN